MTLSNAELIGYRNFSIKLAMGAGKILTDGFHRTKKIHYKGTINPVTQFDMQSERYIISHIAGKYPDHDILAEEGGGADNGSAFRWVVDPLDGTVNYAHGFPVYSVSIALQYENESVVGVVYDPERREMFSAVRHGGAFLNGKRMKVSSEHQLARSLLATGFAYNIATARRNNLGTFARMMKTAQAVRRLGSAALDLCWVAAGRLDGFWEYYLHPWDTAAAMLIVTEAGGEVSRIGGGRYAITDHDLLASNGLIHQPMARALAGKIRAR